MKQLCSVMVITALSVALISFIPASKVSWLLASYKNSITYQCVSSKSTLVCIKHEAESTDTHQKLNDLQEQIDLYRYTNIWNINDRNQTKQKDHFISQSTESAFQSPININDKTNKQLDAQKYDKDLKPIQSPQQTANENAQTRPDLEQNLVNNTSQVAENHNQTDQLLLQVNQNSALIKMESQQNQQFFQKMADVYQQPLLQNFSSFINSSQPHIDHFSSLGIQNQNIKTVEQQQNIGQNSEFKQASIQTDLQIQIQNSDQNTNATNEILFQQRQTQQIGNQIQQSTKFIQLNDDNNMQQIQNTQITQVATIDESSLQSPQMQNNYKTHTDFDKPVQIQPNFDTQTISGMTQQNVEKSQKQQAMITTGENNSQEVPLDDETTGNIQRILVNNIQGQASNFNIPEQLP